MKTYLMFADRDVEPITVPGPDDAGVVPDLIQDLELNTLWDGMAGGDAFLRTVAQAAVLDSLTSVEQIRFRQRVLADCLAHPDVVRALYDLAVVAITGERKIYRGLYREHAEMLLHRSVEVVEMFVGVLRQLRQIVEEHAAEFTSDGFTRLFGQLRAELDDDYFAEIAGHLSTLRFHDGIVVSARLDGGNKGTDYVLRRPKPENRGHWPLRSVLKRPTFAFTIPDRDDAGYQALGRLRDTGLGLVARALGQSADHVLSFFVALRTELGFYLGALNLAQRMAEFGAPACFPNPLPFEMPLRLSATELTDPCLTMRLARRAVGNDVAADGMDVIVITGANQGGKSTFLRSLGLAQLMMQAGLFTVAADFTATVVEGVFTHYKREEDATMRSGKFDEELARMSDIADHIGPHCLLMCNESFAATNEREGSDIAAEVIRAMTDAGVRVVFVTHMFDLASRYTHEHTERTLFLRADREEGGRRSFRLQVAPPLPTSFGEDLYWRTFTDAVPRVSAPPTAGRSQ